MKKGLLFLLFAFFATSISYGQFALGLKIGYNANKLSTNLDSIKNSMNSGFHVGAWARFGKRLYFRPELVYTLSGGEFTKGNPVTTGWTQKIKVGSLDIPVLVGLKIIHSDFITWRVELGPEASFVVNKKITDDGLTPPIQLSDIKTANWYLLGGTGVDVLFLSLDIRYKYGLTKSISNPAGYSLDTKNSMFVVSLGFKILGKK
ncbi:MAG: porin family protein [Bacteroidota bacterium]